MRAVPRALLATFAVAVWTAIPAMATPARADAGLASAVAAAYFPRTEDAGLHAIAHERALEISSCAACMTHALMRSGTAEVLGTATGYGDPVAAVIGLWRGSPAHHAILSDARWGHIGCADRVAAVTHYFVCVLSPATVAPAQPAIPQAPQAAAGLAAVPPPAPPIAALPDTAMP